MNSLKCLVIFSACACFGVIFVDGIRVPSAWNEPRDNHYGRNIGSDGYYRFNVNLEQKHSDGKLIQRRNSLERENVIPEHESLPNRLPNTAPSNVFGSLHQPTFLSQGEIFILSNNNQETSIKNKQNIEAPAITSKYPDSQLKYKNKQPEAIQNYVQNSPLKIGTSSIDKVQAQIPGFVEYGINEKYPNAPNDVLPIAPILQENLHSYRENERAKLKQPTLNQLIQKYNPEGYKKYTQRGLNSHDATINAPSIQSLNNYVPQNHKFISSASEKHSSSTPSPIESVEFTTKKEPLFFVTEGYRNVLVQGPNKKRKYQRPHYQNKDESKKVINTEKLESDDNSLNASDEDNKPSRRRKVTKIYKIHGNNGERNRNVGGYNNNLIDSKETEKQRQYFQRPNIYTEDDRRADFRKHLIKNYRDDILHEPVSDYDVEREVDDVEKINNDDERHDEDERNDQDPEIEEDEVNRDKTEVHDTDHNDEDSVDDVDEEVVPHSEHTDPEPVPTKPIYPGEGAWAKKGVKHSPFISQHRFLKPQDADEKPDGHDVFEDLEKYFEKQKDQFGMAFGEKLDQPVVSVPNSELPVINSPNPVNPIVVYDPFSVPIEEKSQQIPSPITNDDPHQEHDEGNDGINQEDNEEEDEDAENEESDKDEEENDEFVPVQLYTQVRKSENEEHEPHDPLEHGRLREIIKDSKIHTVYTEEGYEDSAYDHAGHEKKAEEDQGHEEFEREKFEKIKPSSHEEDDSNAGHSIKAPDVVLPLEDSLASDSIFPSLPKHNYSFNNDKPKLLSPKPAQNNNFMTTKEVKTTQVKDKKNGDVQLEIQSEVKMILQPNNSTKAHKYVKIYPKVFREYSNEGQIQAKRNLTGTADEEKITDVKSAFTDKNSIKVEGDTNATQVTSRHETVALESDENESSIHSTRESIETSTSSSESASPKVLIKAYNNEFDKIVSTEQPKVKVKILDDEKAIGRISYEFDKIDTNRRKRSIDDIIKEVDIDIGFVDKINNTFAPKLDDINAKKYPYYTRPDVNENSPLRYAENMENIPVKKEGELSFYKIADKHDCPEIPHNIDPIPEHVKNSHKNRMREDDDEREEDDDEGEDETENDASEDEQTEDEQSPTPKTPRIELRDKIECLKSRYFGDNPLDSPIFWEKTVGPVKPIFKELEQKSNKLNKDGSILQDTNNIKENFERYNEKFNQLDQNNERKFKTDVKDKVYNALNESRDKLENAESIRSNVRVSKSKSLEKLPRNDHTEAPPITLITTPKYTIQLTPKNIYDQIRLLDHLPEEQEDTTEVEETSTKRIKETIMNKKTETIAAETTERNNPKKDAPNILSRRQPKMLSESKISNTTDQKDSVEDSPEAEALRRRRFRPRRPTYQIFDVNRFLPTTPFPIIQQVHSTVLPKSMVKSEVYYKDEIKPSEQLNVFADVLNNIKNSTKNDELVQLQSASNFAEPSAVTISTLDDNHDDTSNVRVKKYQRDSSSSQYHKGLNFIQSSTEKHFNARYPVTYEEHYGKQNPSTNKYVPDFNANFPNSYVYVNKNTESKLESAVSHPKTDEDEPEHSNTKTINRKVLKKRRRPIKGSTSTTSTTAKTTTNINVPKHTVPSNHQPYVIDYIEDTEGIVGLVPPSKVHYTTIVGNSAVENTNEILEQVQEYKTIEPSTITEPVTSYVPAPVTELSDELPPVRSINNYYFLGLKPPLAQRARPYTEFIGNDNFINNNVVKRRIANYGQSRLRLKREAARSYSEVSRNRGSQNEGLRTTSAEDIDDYVPHRPTNFHYDEKTGKIVYHKKPQEDREDEEEEEYEEIEIPDTPGIYLERAEDATHPTPKKVTTNPLLATATPPPEGKGLLDFVAKLKNHPSYQYISDPTTPDQDTATTTTQSSAIVEHKSTNPPEFLNILAKVKSDSNYKLIEDPKESKSKSKSTTTPEPEDEEYEDEEEDDDEEGSTSKQRFRRQSSDLLIFNVGDFLPKIQSPISSPIPKTPQNFLKKQILERIFPKLRYMTPLDIAKEKFKETFQNTTIYKFIEKNIRNSPGEQAQELSNIQIFDVNEYIPKVKQVSPKTTIDYSKYKTIERPHVRHNMSSRYNSEEQPILEEVVTVRRPIIMEERESIDRPVVSEEKVIHNKGNGVVREDATTQRIVHFRRGTRPTTQRTTAQTAEYSESVATRRSTNRRRPVPSTYKVTRRPTTTTQVTEATEKVERVYPQSTQTERSYLQTNGPAKRVYRRRPVRIRHTTERQEENDEAVDRIARMSLGSEFDQEQDEFERGYLEDKGVEGVYEEVKDEIINGGSKNSILTDKIVKVAKKDNTKENADSEEKETSESNKKEISEKPAVKSNRYHDSANEVRKNYQGELDEENIEAKSLDKTNNEEVVDEDKTRKSIKTTTKNDNSQSGDTVNKDINEKDVEVFKDNFDETKKHGGNYKSRKNDDDFEIMKQRIDEVGSGLKVDMTKDENVDKGAIVEKDVRDINREFDRAQRHGGNYRPEKEELLLQANKKAVKIRHKDVREFSENTKAELGRSRNYDEEAIVEEVTNDNKKHEAEIIDQSFDTTKKHGGNYLLEHDAVNYESESEEKDARSHLIPRGIRSKNVITNEKTVEEPKILKDNSPKKAFDNDENGVKNVLKKKRRYRVKPPSSATLNTNGITRLTDVVPKPDHFYSDTQLPKEVNKLKINEDKITLSSEELEQITQDGDIISDTGEPPVGQTVNNRRHFGVYSDSDKNVFDSRDNEEQLIKHDEERETVDFKESDSELNEEALPTKKPLFIKDPSKRLYYYVQA